MNAEERSEFVTRVWLVLGPVVVVLAALFFLWKAFSVALVIFGGILFGIFLQALGELAARHLGLPYRLAVALVSALVPLLLGAIVVLVGPSLVEQFGRLAEELPAAVDSVQERLRNFAWGEAFLPGGGEGEGEGGEGAGWDLLDRATGVFSTTLGAVVNVFIVGFLGLYFALTPRSYRKAVAHMLPVGWRERAGQVMGALGAALRSWLLGRFAAMAVVLVLTAGGLLLLGVPLALSLSLLAGLLNFVPYLGPVAAAVPALLVAGAESFRLALWVGVFYTGVQLFESFVATPWIQKKAVSIPPALLVASQILLGLAGGIVGLLLATPIAVATVVLVQTLYVEDVLEEDVRVLGS